MDANALSGDHCRSMLGVYRTGSLSAAARMLGVTQPTIARHIEQLEAALGGAALFTRSPQGLSPTDAAEALIPHALAMESAAAAMVRAASGRDDGLAGAVRLTASKVIGTEVLPAMLVPLSAAYPQLAFELLATNDTSDLLRRDACHDRRSVRPRPDRLRSCAELPPGLSRPGADTAA